MPHMSGSLREVPAHPADVDAAPGGAVDDGVAEDGGVDGAADGVTVVVGFAVLVTGAPVTVPVGVLVTTVGVTVTVAAGAGVVECDVVVSLTVPSTDVPLPDSPRT